ncbi:MAG: DNA topoisomerase IB [Chloroflexia bacterium]|nr:DNA topoisomerase IB [Chloroflexia bacterium]
MSTSPATTTIDRKLLRREGLRHVNDRKPGFTRTKRGTGWSFHNADGALIADKDEIQRIRSIAVPPAWTDVWICPWPTGHIQATGLDARGRKQYRYHPKWREVRDDNKYQGILAFADALPAIRKRVEHDIALPGLLREKVLATVVRLLEVTLIRVGNASYAKENESYGLTTIRKKHVAQKGSDIRFRFTGKSGKEWDLSVKDRRIASVVRKCSELPGYELFKYEDDNGELVDVTSADINAYLQEITGEEFTSKDFRTWAGTVLAAMALDEFDAFDSSAEAKKNVVSAIETVSRQLGNTPAICRKCYVHPAILDSYLDGELAGTIGREIGKKVRNEFGQLSAEEIMVLAFLKKRL